MAQPNKAEIAIARALHQYGYLIVRSFKQFTIGQVRPRIEWNWEGETLVLERVKIIGEATYEEAWEQSLKCGFGMTKAPFYYKIVEA